MAFSFSFNFSTGNAFLGFINSLVVVVVGRLSRPALANPQSPSPLLLSPLKGKLPTCLTPKLQLGEGR